MKNTFLIISEMLCFILQLLVQDYIKLFFNLLYQYNIQFRQCIKISDVKKFLYSRPRSGFYWFQEFILRFFFFLFLIDKL